MDMRGCTSCCCSDKASSSSSSSFCCSFSDWREEQGGEETGRWPASRERTANLGLGFSDGGGKALTLRLGLGVVDGGGKAMNLRFGLGFREDGDKAVTLGLGFRLRGEEMLSRDEMLWFQACCRSTGMTLVASTETQGGREPAPAFQGRKRSPQVGEAIEGLSHTSRAAGTTEEEEMALGTSLRGVRLCCALCLWYLIEVVVLVFPPCEQQT